MRRITKRKIKKFLSNNTYVLLFIAVFTILGFMTTGYALLKSTGTLNGFAEIIANSEPDVPGDITEVCVSDIDGVMRTQPWPTGTNMKSLYDVTITNSSDETYYNWKMKMYAPQTYLISSSHATVERDGDYVLISSLGWNGVIEPGESTTFEMSAEAPNGVDMANIFSGLAMIVCGRATDEKEEVTDGNASIELGQQEVKLDVSFGPKTQMGAWGGSVNLYEVVLTNNTEYSTTDIRTLIYYGPYALNTAYPVKINRDEPANYILEVTNTATGNAPLAPGESFSFTLVINTRDTTFYPDIVAAGLKRIA